MKKLSIIIVNYNTDEFLRQCLDSLGEIPHDWELFIVDNGSKNRLKIDNEKLHVIRNEKNTGFAVANNQAIKKATGEYVLLLNPDTIVSQKTITYVMDYMDSHTDVGIATCRANLVSGKLDDASHRGFPTPWNAFCHFSGLSALFPHTMLFNGYHLGYKNMNRVHEIDACAGAFMMIRTTAGEPLQWLDEDYFWYGEDIDFCFRIKQTGWKIVYIPDVSITHYKGVSSGIKRHSQNMSTADEKTTKKAQDARFSVMQLFYQKHYSHRYPWIIRTIVLSGIRFVKLLHVGIE